MPAELHDQLQDRLATAQARAATSGDPQFGTVELTIGELSDLLDHLQDTLAPT